MEQYPEYDDLQDEDFGGGDVPPAVQQFAQKLNRHLNNHNVYEIQTCYEVTFSDLTERLYKNSPWPDATIMGQYADDDDNFLVLYKELYFRHVYSSLHPNLADRLDSFQNYVDLFNVVLGLSSDEPEIELPEQWLWDMVDEFIYQFQSFHQYRTRVKSLSAEEKAELREREHVWSAQTVIRYLHALVKKGQLDIAAAHREGHAEAAELKDDQTPAPMFRTLAYFSLIGLCRVNCLLGDYTSALRALSPVDLRDNRAVFTSVVACHTTLYYYMGFAYLMTRRYMDAIKTFTSFLAFMARTKSSLPRNFQHATIMKTTERMHGLLALALSFCPYRLDEQLNTAVRDKFGEFYGDPQPDTQLYTNVFLQCAPKFVTLAAPNYNEDVDTDREGANLQLKLFLGEVSQRQRVPDIAAHLKLCTAVSVTKLASFLDVDEDTCTQLLLCLKHKSRNMRWKDGPPLSGELTACSDVNFYVDQSTVHMIESNSSRRYGEYFVRNIQKFEDLIDDIRQITPARR